MTVIIFIYSYFAINTLYVEHVLMKKTSNDVVVSKYGYNYERSYIYLFFVAAGIFCLPFYKKIKKFRYILYLEDSILNHEKMISKFGIDSIFGEESEIKKINKYKRILKMNNLKKHKLFNYER